jgi:hypothetical protein
MHECCVFLYMHMLVHLCLCIYIHTYIKKSLREDDRPYVINWIDSKGMFADEETFEENHEQLKSYVNRYGAEHVVYIYLYSHLSIYICIYV